MRRRHPLTSLACPLAALALLGGCAEIHHGAEAVGRLGPASGPAVEADAAPPRSDVKTLRPPGAPRRAPDDEAAGSSPTVFASAVPSPRQIFDFHPAGTGPDAWRQPFVIDTSDGPLAADVRRSSAELRAYLKDQKAGAAKAAAADRPRCGENEVAQGKPGCGPAAPRSAAAVPAPPQP